MGGITTLKKIQWGIETAAGTAIAADHIWRGTGDVTDARAETLIEEQVGSMLPPGNQYTAHYEGQVTMEEVEATFEDLPLILDCAIDVVQTGTVNTGGSGYTYTYTQSTDGTETVNTVTLEVGDNQRVDEVEYAFVPHFTLAGASKEAWKVSADWVGRQVTDAEFTTGLSLVAVEPILFGETNMYIDASGGTVGTTTKSNTLVAFSIDWTTGHIPLYSADGAAYFSTQKAVAPEITGTLTLEHETTGEAEITAARANSIRLLRLKAEGAAFTTAGTYTYKTCIVDLAIQYDGVPAMGDIDGNRTVELEWHAVDEVAPTIVVASNIANL